MDQALLVNAGQLIVKALDDEGYPPLAALWAQNSETEAWKLWLVPSLPTIDQRRFYRILSEAIAKHRNELGGIDASDAELVKADHPAISGLKRLINIQGNGTARFTNTRLNGFFLPDSIVLRMAS